MFRTTSSDGQAASRGLAAQRGFTLAGLLVILTVLGVVLAYTVPQMWSDVLRRERDIQTIWTMKQYARAIAEFQRRRQALPVSLEQLKEQNRPRVLRRLYPDPLTGQMDWILIPAGSVPGAPAPGGTAYSNPSPQNPGWGQQPNPGDRPTPVTRPGGAPPPGQSSGQIGPFIGVRPPKTGRSYIALNGVDQYENWSYTVLDLQAEQNLAVRPPGAGMPTTGVPQPPTPRRP